jgi:hypothetical protein
MSVFEQMSQKVGEKPIPMGRLQSPTEIDGQQIEAVYWAATVDTVI